MVLLQVRVSAARWPWQGQYCAAILHHLPTTTSRTRQLPLLCTSCGAAVTDVLLVAQEINACLAAQHAAGECDTRGAADANSGGSNVHWNSASGPTVSVVVESDGGELQALL